jgi:DNA-binding beta-propeller fold protein YncE
MRPVIPAVLLLFFGVAAIAIGSNVAAKTSSLSGYLFVANQFEHTALLVDLSNRKTIFTAGVDINGHEVAISPDRRFGYVPIYGNSGVGKPGTDGSTIEIVDLQTGRTTSIIDLPKPVRPHLGKFAPDGLFYVTAELADSIYAVDVHSHKVVSENPTGETQSHMFVLTPDGSRAYTANVSTGTVSVVDLRKHALITKIPVAGKVQRISISPDGKHVYTHDQEKPRIAVIDAATNTISQWLELPSPVYSSAPTPDGRRLVANSPSGKLFVVDLVAGKLEHAYDIPAAIGAIAITADGSFAYVSCPQAGTVEVLNLRENALEAAIQLTKGVDGLAWVEAIPN